MRGVFHSACYTEQMEREEAGYLMEACAPDLRFCSECQLPSHFMSMKQYEFYKITKFMRGLSRF